MSNEYDSYILEHKNNVRKAWHWIKDHEILRSMSSDWLIKKVDENIEKHDLSKYSFQEYFAYDAYFYGSPYEDVTQKQLDSDFDYAWLHHIGENEHHWQHWLLYRDDGDIVPLDMPLYAIIEMICDWWSFSWKADNLFEIFSWYLKNKKNIKMSSYTKNMVEDILDSIKFELEKSNVS